VIILKIWLSDILACPIDKHFPLKLYIFSYETTENEFNEFLDVYENRKKFGNNQERGTH